MRCLATRMAGLRAIPASHGLAASFCLGLGVSLAVRVLGSMLVLIPLVLGVAAVKLP